MIIYQCDYCEKHVHPSGHFPDYPALRWGIKYDGGPVVSDRITFPPAPWSFCSLECLIDWATDRMAIKPDRRAA